MAANECRLCGAKIRWAKTIAEKAIPLDPDPANFGGNIVLRDGVAVVLGKQDPSGHDERRYRSHFVTCPVMKRTRAEAAAAKKAAERKAKEPPSLFDKE